MLEMQGAEIIKLNIGGHMFVTTSQTLLGKGQNYFTTLLDNRFAPLKDGEAYFIDRDGQYFTPLLEYLRTGELHIPGNLSGFD
jgi:BTB/POZ domain-containing adapter for CUL3-mediated RhoA degradation protein